MINDQSTLELILAALTASNQAVAVLHGESAAARGTANSDVDLAVSRRIPDVVRDIADSVGPGVALALYWPYDYGSVTTIWIDPSRRSIVQLDMMNDRTGRNRYGIKTPGVISRRVEGDKYPRACDFDSLAYMISKDVGKGRVPAHRVRGVSAAWQELARDPRISTTISHPRRRAISAALSDCRSTLPRGASSFLSHQQHMRDLIRYARRLALPVGGLLDLRCDLAPSGGKVLERTDRQLLTQALPRGVAETHRPLIASLLYRFYPRLTVVLPDGWPTADGLDANSPDRPAGEQDQVLPLERALAALARSAMRHL